MEQHTGGAEYMSRFERLIADAGPDIGGRVEWNGTEERVRRFGILDRIKGFHRVVGGARRERQRLAAQVALVEKSGVPFLDGGGVGQHGAAKVRGAGAGEDGSV